MAKAQKFTFKRQKRITGLAGVGNPHQSVHVKFGGKWCGTIQAPNWQSDGWRPRIVVVAPENECGWGWVAFKPHETEQSARDWFVRNQDALLAKYTLHHIEGMDDE